MARKPANRKQTTPTRGKEQTYGTETKPRKEEGIGNHHYPQKGCYINYMLRVRSITHEMVAEKSGTSSQMVSAFLRGVKNSEKVQKALAEVLGYPSFEAVVAASRGKEAV